MLAWVVGMVYGRDGWQMHQDVLLGVVDGCGSGVRAFEMPCHGVTLLVNAPWLVIKLLNTRKK